MAIELSPRAAGLVSDAVRYAEKNRAGSSTGNLADFVDYAEAIVRAAGIDYPADPREAVRLGIRLAGLYSRYQDAKRADVLREVREAFAEVAPKAAPKPRAPRAAKPKA